MGRSAQYASLLRPTLGGFHAEADEATQGFRARGLVGELGSPGVDFGDFLFRKAECHHWVASRGRTAGLPFWYYLFP